MTTSEYPSLGIIRLPRTILALRGADRMTFLHNLCTNDIKAMSPGEACEAFVTNVQGKILGHVLAAADEQSLTLSTVAGQAEKLIPHFNQYLITEDVQLVDRSATQVQFAACGNQLLAKMEQLTGESLAGRTHREVTCDAVPISVTDAPLAWPHCLLITCGLAHADSVRDALLALGAEELARHDFERLRIEAGFPWYGLDFGEHNLPQEIDRNEQAISFTKGCYLGQETVARIDALGHVNQHLVGFKADAASSLDTGPIHDSGKVVGQITSSAFSPRLNAMVALGIIRREQSDSGTTVEINGHSATVVGLPFT